MLLLKERLRQKYRTLDWPNVQPGLSPRYRGKPAIKDGHCGDCAACYDTCPTGALTGRSSGLHKPPSLDMGACIFCGACEAACPQGFIKFTSDYRVAAFNREALIIHPGEPQLPADDATRIRGAWRLFHRSFRLRQVSAGGCNACEADCNVLGTPVYDLGHFGVEFTASPRHADALALTGPISLNMLLALADTWKAIPTPKLFFAIGSCAISGGLFYGLRTTNGMDGINAVGNQLDQEAWRPIKADIFIPGCPPNPWSILDGLLMAIK